MPRNPAEIEEIAFEYHGPTALFDDEAAAVAAGPAGAADVVLCDRNRPGWIVVVRLSGDGVLRALAVYPSPDFSHPAQHEALWEAWMERTDLSLSARVAAYFGNLGALDGGPRLTTGVMRSIQLDEFVAQARRRAFAEARKFAEALAQHESPDTPASAVSSLRLQVDHWAGGAGPVRQGRRPSISDDDLLDLATRYITAPHGEKYTTLQRETGLSRGLVRSRLQLCADRGILTPPNDQGRTDRDLGPRGVQLLAARHSRQSTARSGSPDDM